MKLAELYLKKNEDRRLRAGHLWIYSNEIDTKVSPLKRFQAGEEVLVKAADHSIIGVAYVNPQSLISARLFSRDKQARLDKAFFIEKFQQALRARAAIFDKPFYRLVYGDSDFIPGLVVDRFDKHLVVQINTKGMEDKKELVVDALKEILPETESILFRNDSSMRELENLEKYITPAFGNPPEKIILQENGVDFTAPLLTGQKTAWFYDHRMNRLRLKDYVKNKKVLDVFSYLGGWGIQAAAWGAKHVTCVDGSQLAIDYVNENAKLNKVSDKITAICDDAFDALKKLANAQEKFDVIIIDPPAFIKKLKDKKEGLIAYQRINTAALKLLNPGGILLSCSCSMHLTEDELVQAVRRASLQTNQQVQIIERGHQAQDHPVHIAIPETDYLKMVVLRIP
jgi:23S rRNA (cytosine1962-C5)-methyltransferase